MAEAFITVVGTGGRDNAEASNQRGGSPRITSELKGSSTQKGVRDFEGARTTAEPITQNRVGKQDRSPGNDAGEGAIPLTTKAVLSARRGERNGYEHQYFIL